MASYDSYKKITTDYLPNNVITQEKVQQGASNFQAFTFWVHNCFAVQCQQCSMLRQGTNALTGRCCLWTVPCRVTKVTFELWSGGGPGAGNTCCNCCSMSIGGAGGNYATKTISVTPGWSYTICAGGTFSCCKIHSCTASVGCRSFVNGCNLSNFCVTGGCGGTMCNGDEWGPRTVQSCANCLICGYFNADFGMMGTVGTKMAHSGCFCYKGNFVTSGSAPFAGKWSATGVTEAFCSCGFWTNFPGGGGDSGVSSYSRACCRNCGSSGCCGFNAICCAGGGPGGSGAVKVTYI